MSDDETIGPLHGPKWPDHWNPMETPPPPPGYYDALYRRYRWGGDLAPERPLIERLGPDYSLRILRPGSGFSLYLPPDHPARQAPADYEAILAHLDIGTLVGEPLTMEALERVAVSLPALPKLPRAVAIHPADRAAMREATEPGHVWWSPSVRVYFNHFVRRGKVWATDHEVYEALFDPQVLVERMGSMAQAFADMMNTLGEPKEGEGDGERGAAAGGGAETGREGAPEADRSGGPGAGAGPDAGAGAGGGDADPPPLDV